jgi:hypothetical protein
MRELTKEEMELVAGGLPPPGKGPTFITEPEDERGDHFEAIVLPNGRTIFLGKFERAVSLFQRS